MADDINKAIKHHLTIRVKYPCIKAITQYMANERVNRTVAVEDLLLLGLDKYKEINK